MPSNGMAMAAELGLRRLRSRGVTVTYRSLLKLAKRKDLSAPYRAALPTFLGKIALKEGDFLDLDAQIDLKTLAAETGPETMPAYCLLQLVDLIRKEIFVHKPPVSLFSRDTQAPCPVAFAEKELQRLHAAGERVSLQDLANVRLTAPGPLNNRSFDPYAVTPANDGLPDDALRSFAFVVGEKHPDIDLDQPLEIGLLAAEANPRTMSAPMLLSAINIARVARENEEGGQIHELFVRDKSLVQCPRCNEIHESFVEDKSSARCPRCNEKVDPWRCELGSWYSPHANASKRIWKQMVARAAAALAADA